jgi:hypothetical protein
MFDCIVDNVDVDNPNEKSELIDISNQQINTDIVIGYANIIGSSSSPKKKYKKKIKKQTHRVVLCNIA